MNADELLAEKLNELIVELKRTNELLVGIEKFTKKTSDTLTRVTHDGESVVMPIPDAWLSDQSLTETASLAAGEALTSLNEKNPASGDAAAQTDFRVDVFASSSVVSSSTRFEVIRSPDSAQLFEYPIVTVTVGQELTPTDRLSLSGLLLSTAREIALRFDRCELSQ